MSAPMKTQGFSQDIYKESATKKHKLDTVRYLEDGRAFAYALAGEALAAGKLVQSAAPSANANNEALSSTQSAAIGSYSVTVTFGGAVTADFYADGWFWINDATGEGHIYRIKTHPAGTADVTVQLYDPIRVALVASTSEWSCVQNRQSAVIQAPASAITGTVCGISPIAVTSGYYFWNQVKGPAVCLVETGDTNVIGNPVTHGTTAGGSMAAMASSSVLSAYGTVMSVNAATEYGLINLAIPGY